MKPLRGLALTAADTPVSHARWQQSGVAGRRFGNAFSSLQAFCHRPVVSYLDDKGTSPTDPRVSSV